METFRQILQGERRDERLIFGGWKDGFDIGFPDGA
jgi:hypothetical protein